MEEWRDVAGFEGLYEVSNLGNVRSVHKPDGRRGRLLKPNRLRQGYLQVTLYLDGKPHWRKVHRLVGFAFIDNPFGKPDINHKNGIKHDNRAENLEWVTKSENGLHAFRVLKIQPNRPGLGKPSHRRKLTSDQIREIRKDPRTCSAIAKDYGVVQQTISNIKLGYFYKEIV